MLKVCLVLYETAKLSSKARVPLGIPTSTEWEFLVLRIRPHLRFGVSVVELGHASSA